MDILFGKFSIGFEDNPISILIQMYIKMSFIDKAIYNFQFFNTQIVQGVAWFAITKDIENILYLAGRYQRPLKRFHYLKIHLDIP